MTFLSILISVQKYSKISTKDFNCADIKIFLFKDKILSILNGYINKIFKRNVLKIGMKTSIKGKFNKSKRQPNILARTEGLHV